MAGRRLGLLVVSSALALFASCRPSTIAGRAADGGEETAGSGRTSSPSEEPEEAADAAAGQGARTAAGHELPPPGSACDRAPADELTSAAGLTPQLLGAEAAREAPVAPPRAAREIAASADGTRIDLGGGLALVARGSRLYVTGGGRTAPLEVCGGAARLVSARLAGDGVELTYEGGCCVEEPARFGLRGLEARLENVGALAHHRDTRYGPAAEGFARAVALDPSFEKAATNLACALALQGKRAEAVAALAPMIASRPVAAYAAILADPELSSLLEAPEVGALRAARPGTAKVGVGDVTKLVVAVSADGRLVAASDRYDSWGASVWSSDLRVVEIASGREVARLALVEVGDTDPDEGRLTAAGRRAVAERTAVASRLLADLGFDVPASLERGELERDGDHFRARFPRARTSLVVKGGAARVLRGDRVLGENARLPAFFAAGKAALLPEPGVALFRWAVDEPEGCDHGGELVGVAFVPYRPFVGPDGGLAP